MLVHVIADYGAGGEEVCWMELFLRGGSAWEAFGRPPVGKRVEITRRHR
jgi:hypothetical protein